MKRRLPPLNALRTFEAAAHRLNFTLAASDLAVTATAVSHQIRHLEEWFGLKLFVRHGRHLALSEAGVRLYPVLRDALQQVEDASHELQSMHQNATLTVSVTPTFGSRWLASRLGRFFAANPDIDLRIHHSVNSVDFSREDVDAAIRWGFGPWPNTESEKLMDAVTVPMCSPALLQGKHELKTPADLKYHTLLHDADYQEWTEWLIAAGLQDIDGQRGPIIGDANTLVRAAVEGLGVFLGTTTMMSKELGSGDLVQPFELTGAWQPSYFLVYPPNALKHDHVRAFRDFLFQEV